ncbi:DUF4082 domain-containing protein [Diaminobutyricimonas sp. LJ205]|uniref:DUF4082 domain-containing protein n=1 Tax=Diaminobutyricimonas sp. LJ205 TaxID=2683590 RepID=UPI0012F47E4B|nr:DUF4082 domain-containing protein [Diaminobutyricimonas sp. LJ205]
MVEASVDPRDAPLRRRVAGFASLLATSALVLTSLTVLGPASIASAAEPCGAGGNKISCENSQPGTDPAIWDIRGAGDPSIQGFATDISVNIGSRVDFKIDTDAADYTIDIYRTGWYQGLGARYITSVEPSAALPQMQPECISDQATELYDCGTWGVSASWSVPSNAVSGVYIAHLLRTDNGDESHITFIVRDDSSTSDILFQTSDPTWHAYNSYGGSDFYQGAANGRAYKISYNRPFATRNGDTQRDFYFSSEYALVRFLERNGYDVSYASGVDTDRFGGHLLNHDVFLSVGHDEYWSGAQRRNIEAARDAGVNLQFLTGNEGYWRTRYEPAASSDRAAYRTLVSYKETWSNSKIDPSTEWTGTWRDPRFAPQSSGAGTPENALTGTMYMVNHDDLPVTVSAQEGKLRLWRNTSLASMAAGTSAELAPHTVGYESNEDIDNGFRPQGLIHLSTTTGPTPQYLLDYGNTVEPGSTTHNLTLYRAASGALVFSSASVQWSWGLDDFHDGDGAPPDPRMQQAQVNVLADMGAQPATLMAGLVQASASTDSAAPTASVVSPVNGASIANGAQVTVTGTANDAGGRVAGVEVSTDGGATWRLAEGTTNWSYTYVQSGLGAAALMARAIDDSANYPSTPTSVSLTVTGPASALGTEVPATVDSGDRSAVELGLQFSPEADGYVAGVRFYKSELNTGNHVGTLWDAAGSALGSVAFTSESAAGWQTAYFTEAVPVLAGQVYTVSYSAPAGHYSVSPRYWPYAARSSSPITIAPGYQGATAGVYGNLGQFPANRYDGSNYFVDVVFDTSDRTPLIAVEQWPAPGATAVVPSTAITARFTTQVDPSSVAVTMRDGLGSAVSGATSYDPDARIVTFTPAGALATGSTYFVQLAATSIGGEPLVEGAGWSFTTATTDVSASCPCSLFQGNEVPGILEVGDRASVELGVKFTPQTSGSIMGLKYYKSAGNVGTHVGTLWAADGRQLASATFTGETTSGWQTVYFSTPVDVRAGSTYVASYRATAGSYSATLSAFASPYTSGPLRVPASGGAYTYGTGFPASSSTTNYFVDVIFVTDPDDPSAIMTTSTTPVSGATDVPLASQISAVLSGAPQGAEPTITVSNTDGPVSGTATWDATSKTISFAPGSPLEPGTVYQARVQVGAATIVGGQWSFLTTDYVPQLGDYSLFAGELPATVTVPESAPVELGTAFSVAEPGAVTAIRFYKGPGNTGTHVGSLWSSTGERMAQVTFTGETAQGWQTAALATPVMLNPGVRYVVSYHAPNGYYSYSGGYFTTQHTNGPLTADTVANGRYRYGGGGVMPEASWNASNYFVDVVFSTSYVPPAALPSVTASSPTPGQAPVQPTTAVSATLGAEPPAEPTIRLQAGTAAVDGSSSYDPTTRTVTFTPAAPLPYGTDFTATVLIDGRMPTGGGWSFTTVAAPLPTGVYSLLDGTLPRFASASDSSSIELGMAFTTNQPGTVTAIRFYKGLGNGGTHVGTIWSAAGSPLARVTFTGETNAGWQTAALATPLALTPGERYIVSYYAPQGTYSATPDYFSTARTNGPLSAETAANGRFLYGTGGYPTESWNATNYFVDVLFQPDAVVPPPPPPDPEPEPEPTPVPIVTGGSPADGASDIAPTTSVSAQVSNVSEQPTFTLTGSAGAVVGATTWDETTSTLTFTPTDPLAWATRYTATITVGQTVLSGGTWSFTTAIAPPTVDVVSLFGTDAIPQHPAWDDPRAVQFGTRFTASAAGEVLGIRFYKGAANTGVHTGSLWSTDGTRVAQVAFTDESPSGWQLAMLPESVRLEVGREYRVTVHSSTGRYAVDLNGLQDPRVSGPLSTPATGGTYVYGTDYPTDLTAHNFWVDVLFAIDP